MKYNHNSRPFKWKWVYSATWEWTNERHWYRKSLRANLKSGTCIEKKWWMGGSALNGRHKRQNTIKIKQDVNNIICSNNNWTRTEDKWGWNDDPANQMVSWMLQSFFLLNLCLTFVPVNLEMQVSSLVL